MYILSKSGGWVSFPQKHKDIRDFKYLSGFFITTNEFPVSEWVETARRLKTDFASLKQKNCQRNLQEQVVSISFDIMWARDLKKTS